jgi:hypothetical protein
VEEMAEYCSCGAQLPDDARFCHRCGKPQREEPVAQQLEAPIVESFVAAPVTPIAPSFHHPVAVRIGLLVASVATLLFLAIPFGFVIWLPAAGFISVYLFRRRTGQTLSVRGGARMGWIAGILSFLILTVLFTMNAVALASRPGGLAASFKEELQARSMPSDQLDAVMRLLASPVNQALLYLVFLLILFTVIAVFCTAGGALGAKVLDKD